MKPLATEPWLSPSVAPRSRRNPALPDMYDLPSEYPEEPGLPDEFHDLQPQLLSRTLALVDYTTNEWFTCSDLNVYYDVEHFRWHKRPDWFLAVGVSRLYNGQDSRQSYVAWQEGRNPHVVVEFLSRGTTREDLGRFYKAEDEPTEDTLDALETRDSPASSLLDVAPQSDNTEQPPPKFIVYEEYLQVPHYLVYDRKTRRLRYFQFVNGRYEEQPTQATNPCVWLADLQIGLGIWQGKFEGLPGYWLRWCQEDGSWLLTDTEQERQAKEQERQAKEQERQAKEQEQQAKERAQEQVLQAARQLLATGMSLEQVAALLGLSTEQIEQLQASD